MDDAKLVIEPKNGDEDTVFTVTGTGYKDGVLAIDFGDGASTSVSVIDGNFHISYKYGDKGNYDLTTKYVGEDDVIDTVGIKVK